jgi:hypothetical protein
MDMNRLCLVFVILAALSAGGCATITTSEMQQVALTTKTGEGTAVEGVKCDLRNDKGTWQGTSPGFVSVHKSSQDLNVECKKEGQPDGLLRAISRAGAGMFGNIIFGGGVGAIIDHTKGTAYNYPDNMPVVMGGSVTVDRAAQTGNSATTNPGSAASVGGGPATPVGGAGTATAPPK